MDGEIEMGTSLSEEQLACISRLAELFPDGFLFCTPLTLDGREERRSLDEHLLFSCHEFPRMWSALHGFFKAERRRMAT